MDDHRARRVTSVHTRSTTTKRTENKCSAIVACGWCVAQTMKKKLSMTEKYARKRRKKLRMKEKRKITNEKEKCEMNWCLDVDM